jgi:hypothetical protein
MDGINHYSFLQNDGINQADLFGLWKWKDGKRVGGERSVVVAEKCSDPYEDLANLVRLDASEVKYWLETWKENEKVNKDDEFTVPNIFVVAVGESGWPNNAIFELWRDRIATALTSEGFFVKIIEQKTGRSHIEVIRATSEKDTWGYAFMGHGVRYKRSTFDLRADPSFGGANGSFSWEGMRWITPFHIHKSFKYGLGINFHCFADEQPWDDLSVTYYGGTGFMRPWAGTIAIDWYGTWSGLINSAAGKKE